jgi:hypothetical protein
VVSQQFSLSELSGIGKTERAATSGDHAAVINGWVIPVGIRRQRKISFLTVLQKLDATNRCNLAKISVADIL